MSKMAFFRELWEFMGERKIWWMAPIIIVIVLMSVFIVLTESSAVLPFVYALF
ncbi:DUF5989 family protein [candidate division CSSED10-310 bacterium]|uniref:DUF5989 family protein n=1 Tax=candidate division CSSED10-310 bacterium TaxID=2855610 RepID=A0ABV6YSB9_UNCC1